MAGHSKWANIKHRKERADKKKGKIFSRIIKEIMSAVRQGGKDPKTNQKLRLAMQKAKEANVPNENIERNIKKAASSEGKDYFSLTYELYGYGGVGIIVDILTDNKNRISSDIRIATNKCGGSVASLGSVAFNFDRKGLIIVDPQSIEEDELFLFVLENGAEGMSKEEEGYRIITSVEQFIPLKEALKEKGIKLIESELAMIPKTLVELTDDLIDSNIALIEWLENIDDVDAVYHNMKLN